MVDDLAAGGEPDTVMAADVFQCDVERANAVGVPDQKRVQAGRHHMARCLAFAVEYVELPSKLLINLPPLTGPRC